MAITRVTQHMISQRSLSSLQTNLSRMAKLQEQLSSGRTLNRPSDSVSGTASAMRLRDKLATVQQYQNNAQDGLAWLGTTDTAMTTITDAVREARDVGLQGANGGSLDQAARDALASQIDGLREQLVSEANTSYLGRPIFGGTTGSPTAYDANGAFQGDSHPVERTVGAGVTVRVDISGPEAFSVSGDDLFKVLGDATAALTSGADPSSTLTRLDAVFNQMKTGLADIGARENRIDQATNRLSTSAVDNTTALSNIENIDIASAITDLQMQQVSYQASLGATARVIQPSLLDFLR